MAGILKSLGIEDRDVWVADSFSGIPVSESDSQDRQDVVDEWEDRFAASFEEVKANFLRYDLLGENIKFLKGFFADTLPSANIDRISIARLDGDSYDSTMDALQHIYPRISSGGYVIIDDWHVSVCRQAVFDYRQSNGVDEPIFFKKSMYGPRSFQGAFEAYWRVG